ncbi:unnamed protein product [Ilex paraguariensis]|uniref:3'-5' exonuclease domain-containing protein n=1 Tax=Ilex paraguariensis TaxID=185542 RepID=A0ABC8RNX5_9AQUA
MYTFNNFSNVTFNTSSCKYNVNFARKTKETTVTDKAAITTEWVREIYSLYAGKPMVVGLDIEWRPNLFRSMTNKTATLQLCIQDKCLILQLFYMDEIPQSLKSILADSNFTFAGVEVANDISKLKNEYGLECCNSVDIRELAKNRWPGRFRRPG